MRKTLLILPFALLGLAGPAQATGGLVCRTAGVAPVEVALGFGHVPGAPLIATRLSDRGGQVPVTAPQWWLDQNEVRVVLVAPQALREEARIHARRNGHTYDGSLWRDGKQRWVRCREG